MRSATAVVQYNNGDLSFSHYYWPADSTYSLIVASAILQTWPTSTMKRRCDDDAF